MSSTTPRNTLPPPSRPAAIAPWIDSVAPVQVSRAASTVGVSPWSASDTRTASNSWVSPGEGRRPAARRKACSVKVTVPISSRARSRPRMVMASGEDVPIPVRSQSSSSVPIAAHRPALLAVAASHSSGVRSFGSWCLATRPVGVWGSSATTSR